MTKGKSTINYNFGSSTRAFDWKVDHFSVNLRQTTQAITVDKKIKFLS